MDGYRKRLARAKECYPFSKWAAWGIEQHTDEAVHLFASLFNDLIERLTGAGESAPDNDKLAMFQQAVEALNSLAEKDEILIETDEREDLCALFNVIATAAGLDPKKYADGEGPASKWREW